MIYTSVNLCLQEKKEGINTYDPAQFAWFFYFVPNILSTITSKKITINFKQEIFAHKKTSQLPRIAKVFFLLMIADTIFIFYKRSRLEIPLDSKTFP